LTARFTRNNITYTVRKLKSGNILVSHGNGQYNAMHGADTEGTHSFEVHPCQRRQYGYWQSQLPESEREQGGEGSEGVQPSWSLRKARTDTSIESTARMLTRQRSKRSS
jgi:hypothetical protein